MFPGAGRQSYANQEQQNQAHLPRPNGPPPGFGQQQYGRPGAPPPNMQNNNSYVQQGYERPYQAPPNNNGGQNRNDIQANHAQPGFVNGPNSYQQPQNLSAPPQQAQLAGSGSNNEFSYQYSQCTGRRKGLLIGINYFGTQSELRGCINDVRNIHDFLTTRYGYNPDDIVVLTDDQQETSRVPLRQNILRAMQWLVSGAQPNDALFFHYSGHGGQTKDLDGDEEDGMDDVIYPVDFQSQGHIIDDEMHDILVKSLPPGVRLTTLFDSCHSGTVLDLPYTYSTKGVVKEPNLWKDVGQDGLQAAMAYATGNTGNMLNSLGSMFKSATRKATGNSNRDYVKQVKFSAADIIMISGSKDNQTSADAVENGQASGAMSHAFVKVLSTQPQQTFLSLLQNMRAELSGKYTQKPQLSSSHPINVNLQFLL
ncbi:LANO_0H14114g1_1 [Lachancea nothofagi CBS 11611]|uniref:Metacaspase-1 n=1 Tax=Lachancea nothofagi CBS 11611 TaxID=1266666 RepID=A0A1G4KMR9_9SACH|nr:LANO_0H14114g1_1 [Lachancea nothofagi CBS 11611]